MCAFYVVLCPHKAALEETEAWQASRLPIVSTRCLLSNPNGSTSSLASDPARMFLLPSKTFVPLLCKSIFLAGTYLAPRATFLAIFGETETSPLHIASTLPH